MNATCIWRGHKWETVDEVEVPPVKGLEHIQGISGEKFIMVLQGYKRVHQECSQCGDRRVRREF